MSEEKNKLKFKCQLLSLPVLMHSGLLCITMRLSGTRYLTKIDWTIIHTSPSIVARVMKFGVGMYVDALWVGLEGQGHGSKVKVTRSKNVIFWHFAQFSSNGGLS